MFISAPTLPRSRVLELSLAAERDFTGAPKTGLIYSMKEREVTLPPRCSFILLATSLRHDVPLVQIRASGAAVFSPLGPNSPLAPLAHAPPLRVPTSPIGPSMGAQPTLVYSFVCHVVDSPVRPRRTFHV